MHNKAIKEEEEKAVEKSNIRFYQAFESLSLEKMEEVWDHTDNTVCVHPGWDLFTGWMAIRDSWNRIFQNTQMIKFIITNTKIKIFENIAIVVCLENIETIVNENKIRMGVIATNIFERQNINKNINKNNDNNKWLIIHHQGSVASNYIPPNISDFHLQ
ncbi:MAG TPA: nuclear transport factor 2 family protein [Nitrososphaeraceae archaeon]|nr:nuclear transport factor 2 family protein [Nitrososphaeraceae archaeon]